MVASCCAYGCTERFVKGGPFAFHCFPQDEVRKKLWEKQLRRENFTANKNTRICSKHFEAECFEKEQFGKRRLYPDAVPTKFDFPDHLKKNVKPRKRKTLEGECSATTVVHTSRKKFRYVGDFEEKDMESLTKVRKLLVLAKSDKETSRKKIKNLRRRNQSLTKKISTLEEIIGKMKRKALISDSAGSVLKSSGTAVKEVQDHSPIEPTVKIKEEPADDYPNPSTSKDTANEEFILPHADNIWTSDSVVEPQFTLSVASLAYPNEPEPSDGEQLKKRKRTNSSEITTFASAPNNTEVKPRSPVHNFGEISNPDSSKEHAKDQFDAFGEYIASKLRSLDLVSSTFAQKAIGDIILEAEMGKFLNKTQNAKS